MGKSTMLKVTGILLIIFASIEMLIGLVGMGGSAYLSSDLARSGMDPVASMIGSIGLIITGAYQLVMGILGVTSYNKPQKANRCFKMGIVALALMVANTSLEGIPSDPYEMGGFLFGICLTAVLPILYTIGAYQLKKKQGIAPDPTGVYQEKPQSHL